MAFPTISAQQEINNRKILEDLQLKKQLLQKGVSPVVTSIPNLTVVSANPSMPQFLPSAPQPAQQADSPVNTTARTAWNQANTQSFGFFVPQDSVFGNSILPVLPRFENNLPK
ncbi:unnamed protein product [Hermetia illucens]|uniref:SOSS complex subunit C homolog n=1 Tax=Hermetia illucens TaxID=343691 RepID=A0A7R8V027_HERIL|nr:SOSS complex subunit C homolog [Hermetia illucens]CAD7089744.1 unnamed protein product [Hermetia illucens]